MCSTNRKIIGDNIQDICRMFLLESIGVADYAGYGIADYIRYGITDDGILYKLFFVYIKGYLSLLQIIRNTIEAYFFFCELHP